MQMMKTPIVPVTQQTVDAYICLTWRLCEQSTPELSLQTLPPLLTAKYDTKIWI